MIDQLSILYLSAEEIQSKLNETSSANLSEALSLIKADIVQLEKAIEDNGAIQLTAEQVNVIFAEVNDVNTRSVTKPADTSNTRYYLYGPYTISTTEGDCTYFYVTATCLSTNSNMSQSVYIPMNENRVSTYIGSVVDVYVGKQLVR